VPTVGPENSSVSATAPQRTRTRILRAATMIFAAKGPDAARVDEIAACARVNKRMLYHYFGTKRGLYLSVLQETYERIGQISAEVIDKTRDVRELLDEMLREYFGFLQQNPEFIALLNWENSTRAEGLKTIAQFSNPAKPFMTAFHRALDREQKKFNIQEDVDIKYLMMACLALCTYYFTNHHTLSATFEMDLDDPACTQQWIDHVRRLILDGIVYRKNSEQENC
jgi:AcrR family transcriptional regulator